MGVPADCGTCKRYMDQFSIHFVVLLFLFYSLLLFSLLAVGSFVLALLNISTCT